MDQTAPIRNNFRDMDLAAGLVSEPGPAAKTLLARALDYCVEKMGLVGPQSALDCLRAGQQTGCGYFQFALAKQTAEYLAGLDNEITAAYLYDYEATPEDIVFSKPDPLPTTHLILRVHRRTEALVGLSAALGQALAGVFAQEAGLPLAQHLLDVQFVDDGEARRGTGYASLLNSFNLRPLLVWER